MIWVVTLFQLNNFKQLEYEYDLMIDKIYDNVHLQFGVLRHIALKMYIPKCS